jgi:predicted nucleic acid-binding protein
VTRAYFDASAIVKLIHHERESLALFELLHQELDACTSAVSEIEVVRTLSRLAVPREEANDALRGFYVIGIDAAIRARAANLTPSTVRSLDAIHLATALEVGADIPVVTYDQRMADAARALGLMVMQPGRS